MGGFTLVENLVATAFIAMMFTGLYLTISHSVTLSRASQENVRATELLTEKMELMRLYSWDQVTNGNVIPTQFVEPLFVSGGSSVVATGQVQVSQAPFSNRYSSSLRMVTIQLSWISGSQVRTREMKSLVGENGLQAYVY